MEDFCSVRARIFARLGSIDGASANRPVIPGVNAYNQGDYQRALSLFLGSIMEISRVRDAPSAKELGISKRQATRARKPARPRPARGQGHIFDKDAAMPKPLS
jgi:hypothetical protein